MKAIEINCEWNTTLRFVPNFPQFALNLTGLTTTSVSETTLCCVRGTRTCVLGVHLSNVCCRKTPWVKFYFRLSLHIFQHGSSLSLENVCDSWCNRTRAFCMRMRQYGLLKCLLTWCSAALVPQSKSTDYNKAYVFQCPTYSMIRNKFYYKGKTLIPNITHLPINGLINELMNSSNYFINIQFIKYISAYFDVRNKLLSK